ncbi:glutamine synthetase [Planctomycetales bacterium]|nr:glutamine synthetase [Planctomycetales bacterium]GHT08700.1 glutamine synthetase [Planctomycetales bacterium]GHV22730.1 glutamine synthetase [Planctomycetales bacterium]
MNNRSAAIGEIANEKAPSPAAAKPFALDFYGEDVFGLTAAKKYLPKAVVKKLEATLVSGQPLDPAIAGDVAHGMKTWALERGASHFTHWFQPLTGGTAEKHDSFLEPTGVGEAVMQFSGKNLIIGEPDASSFPSGGLRATFEARGYTAWDPSSPAFIKRHANGATLCIPTAFYSYTGEALDTKTPLLRSIQALQKSVKRLMTAFGAPAGSVKVTLGPEQEYFLIDKKFYLNRPDLVQTGRTLFGAPPPKHQQLEDHYFGAIRPRILAFMTEVETELWKLGIPAKTRHNEVAPAQFELAPMFEELNLAVDHNMLAMEVLRQTAERHGLVCLLHEKPFAGINGSGKHNNWSVSYGDANLLEPGDSPHQNARFLTVLTAIVRAIDLHSDILRTGTAYAGNDHRLGANEAPPAIISIFLGEQLTDIIEQIEKGEAASSKEAGTMKIGVDLLPPLPKDATDRNRTSPFAFTGNKFEFRAPGSSQSCATVNTLLNTIVAESLDYLAGKIESFGGGDFNQQLQKLLQAEIVAHKRIIFNGDNYSAEWAAEAERRGLPNHRTTMAALAALRADATVALFEKYGVLNRTELESRFEIYLEEYHRKIMIEGKIAIAIAKSSILPVVAQACAGAARAHTDIVASKIDAGLDALFAHARALGTQLDALTYAIAAAEKALALKHEDIIAATLKLREVVDGLETTLDDAQWPLPKYREMLFVY